MRGLISQPDNPLTVGLNAAGAVALAIGLPATVTIMATMVLRYGLRPGFWTMLAVCIGGTLVLALAAGIGRALWALVQLWAYERVLEQPPDE